MQYNDALIGLEQAEMGDISALKNPVVVQLRSHS